MVNPKVADELLVILFLPKSGRLARLGIALYPPWVVEHGMMTGLGKQDMPSNVVGLTIECDYGKYIIGKCGADSACHALVNEEVLCRQTGSHIIGIQKENRVLSGDPLCL